MPSLLLKEGILNMKRSEAVKSKAQNEAQLIILQKEISRMIISLKDKAAAAETVISALDKRGKKSAKFDIWNGVRHSKSFAGFL